eukprot:975158-Rhodomonas_salina.6
MELARIEESAAAVDALFVSSVHLPQTDPSDTSPLPSIWQRGAFSESGEDCSPPAAALAALHDQDPSWRSDTASPHRHAQIEDASRRQESITSTPVIHPEPAARQLFPGWTLTPALHHTAETGPPQSLQHAQLLAHRQPARTTPVLMQSAPPARIRSAPVNPNLKSPAWPGAGARQMQFDPESGRAPEYGDMFML